MKGIHSQESEKKTMKKSNKEEVILTFPQGYTLRSGGEEYELGAYVRFCTKQGAEIVYWDKQEWVESAEEVMGAILAILQDPTRLTTFIKKSKVRR